VTHAVWSAALQGVLHPQMFWSPSIINADMTFSRSGRDLGEVFKSLRFEGVGRLLMEAERLDDGVVVHYSMPSVHAAGILGQHERGEAKRGETSFTANRDGWVGLLDDLGLSFRFVAAPQVEAGALAGQRVLVLPYSTALSDREVAAIRRFVEAGGLLLVDAASGPLRRARGLARDRRSRRAASVSLAPLRATRESKPRVGGDAAPSDRGLARSGCARRTSAASRRSSRRCARRTASRCCGSRAPTLPSRTVSAAAAPST
jgi:hypothetical protein